VLLNDKQVNPMNAKVATGQKLEGKLLAAFNAEKGKIERQIADLASGKTLAAANQ
jgi:hypothetical protein